MGHRARVTHGTLLAVLDNRIKGLLGVCDMPIPDGVESVVDSIDEKTNTVKVVLVIQSFGT